MADINQVITLGVGTPADIPHFVLVGLSPNGSVTPVTGSGTLTIGPFIPVGTGTVFMGGGGRVQEPPVYVPPEARVEPELRAPDAVTQVGRAVWALDGPVMLGRGRVIAPMAASGRLAVRVHWHPGAGTVDQTAGIEEEAFLLGFLLGGE